MSYVDLFIGIVLIIAVVKGYSKGFIVEIFSLLAFFLGLLLAVKFTAVVTAFFFTMTDYYELLAVGVFLGIFIGLMLVVNITAKVIKKVLDLTPFGMFDNALGAVLSLLKMALILSVVYWMLDSVGMELPKNQSENSVILPYIIPIGPKAFELIGAVIPYFRDIFDSVDQFGNGARRA